MKKKAVPAPPEIKRSKDVRPVDPEEVEGILEQTGKIAGEGSPAKLSRDKIVTTPETDMSPLHQRNGKD